MVGREMNEIYSLMREKETRTESKTMSMIKTICDSTFYLQEDPKVRSFIPEMKGKFITGDQGSL